MPANKIIKPLLFTSTFLVPTVSLAQADEAKMHFEIETQPLSSALIKFAETAKVEYIAPANLLEDKSVKALSGNMTPDEALRELLFATGLNYKKQGGNNYLIIPIRTTGDAIPLDGITVFATKRETLIQETPVAVSIVDGDDAISQGKTNIRDLYLLAPSMAYHGAVSSAGQGMRIRGIGSGVIANGVDQSVSTIIDGVVTGPSGSGLQELWDMERVEILRGPQGTLFGKNVSAGAMNLMTRNPTAYKEFFGSARYEFEYQTQRYDFALNSPLSKQVNSRLSGFYLDQAKGTVNNPIQDTTENLKNRFGLRSKLAFQNNESTAMLTISYDESDDSCCSRVFSHIATDAAGNSTLNNVVPALAENGIEATNKNRTSLSETPLYEKSKTLHLVGEYAKKLSNTNTLKTITGLRHWQHQNGRDGDNLPIDMVSFVSDERKLEIFSQELQLVSKANNAWDYLLGAYFYYQKFPTTEYIGGGADFADEVGITTVDSTVNVRNMALFSHTTYHLNEPAALFGGIRIIQEAISARGQQTGGWFAWPQDYPENSVEESDVNYSATLGFQYEPKKNSRFYSSLSRGYKGYAIDTSSNSIFYRAPQYLSSGTLLTADEALLEPETSLLFEAGFKGTFFDDKLLLSAIAFKGEVNNFQASAYDGNSNSFKITNAGEIETQGLEFEYQWQPWNGGAISGSVAWVDARFKKFTGATCQVAQTAAGICNANTGGQNLSGEKVNENPEWQSYIKLQQNFDRETGTLFFNMSYSWRDDVIFDADLDTNTQQNAYGLLDGRAGFRTYEGLSVSLFVNNATNEDYAVRIIDAPVWPGAFQRYPAELRTYGIEVSYAYE